MQRFFKDFESIDRFFLSLDYHQNVLSCHHCSQNNQFVSHGIIYKQRSIKVSEPVGKRLLCSNRYGRSGCGRTFQLYIADQVPQFHYGALQWLVFLTSLFAGFSIRKSYVKATGQAEARHAWRWLSKLVSKLSHYRCVLNAQPNNNLTPAKSRTQRLQLLLPTLKSLFLSLPHATVEAYQSTQQTAFI
jgi:hypothetical protein